MKDKVKIRYVFIGLAFVAVVAWWLHSQSVDACNTLDELGVGWISRKDAEELLGKRILLESPTDLQVRINECPKVNVKVDGKLGPKSNSVVTNEFRDGYEKTFCWEQGIYECQKAGM